MEIKFKDKIDTFDYLIMFDLASKITGVCVWDIKEKSPYYTRVIRVKEGTELPFADLKEKINDFFDEVDKIIGLKRCFVSKEMMPTQIHGGSSTVQTFVALAKSHAILDVCCYERGMGAKDKVTKEMVKDYLYELFPTQMQTTTLDETDAVFLAKTLCEVKWNNDVDERVREEKRHRKTLKAAHAIDAVDKEIERLKDLKIV